MLRARRSSCEWPRLIFIALTMGMGAYFVVWAFLWALSIMPPRRPVPRPQEKWDLCGAGVRPSRAGCECLRVALEAFNP